MLVPDRFDRLMEQAGRPVRVAPEPTPAAERAGVLLVGVRDRAMALGESCAGVSQADLADLLEVVYALGDRCGWSEASLNAVRRVRLQIRGGYRRVLVWEPQEGDAA